MFAFFVDRPLIVNCLMAAVCLVGGATFYAMDRDLIPSLRFKRIDISARLYGAPAVDVERFITFPLEQQVADLPGVKKIKSTTESGRTRIKVIFKADHDGMTESLETIRERVDQIRHLLPKDMKDLKITQHKDDRVPVVGLILKPFDQSNPAHRQWARSFVEAIDKIPHIISVRSGLDSLDLYVEFKREVFSRYGLSVTEVKQKLAEHISYQPLGIVDSHFEKIAIQLDGSRQSLEELKKLPVSTNRGGSGLTLGDVANVEFKVWERTYLRRAAGDAFIEIIPEKDTQSDVVEIEEKVLKVVEEYNGKFPDGIRAVKQFQLARLVAEPLEVLKRNGAFGLLIVTLILLVFLGGRVSVMAAMGLPFVYLGTFIVLDLMGIRIHLISMIGMILVLGILVDDAILVAERFVENLHLGLDAREAAIRAAKDLIRPVTGTIITNIVVFAPILYIESELSTLLYSVPVVIIATLIFSMIESFLILPNHLQHFMKNAKPHVEKKFFLRMQSFYKKVLALSLRFRYIAIVVFVGVFGASLIVFEDMEKSYDFQLDTKNVVARVVVEQSRSLEDTLRQIQPLEEFALKYPKSEVIWVEARAGESYTPGNHLMRGLKEAYVVIEIFSDNVQKTANRIEKEVQEFAKGLPGVAELQVHQSTSNEEGEGNIVTVFVSGGDSLSFDEIQDEVREAIKGVKSVDSIHFDPNRFQKTWVFEPNLSLMSAHGLTRASLAQQIRQHFAQQELMQLRHRGNQIAVYTQFEQPPDHEFDRLQRLRVTSERGISVRLGEIGRWHERFILKKIKHRDLLRKFEIDVAYDKKAVKIEDVQKDLDRSLEGLRKKYPEYHFGVHPPEQTQETKRWLAKVVVACVTLIYLTLVFVLGSLAQPLVVMIAIPFGFTGVVLAFFFHGMSFSLMAIIGLVGLSGVVVNDSLVMLDTVNERRKKHRDWKFSDVVIEGAASRFKAVILTSLTTLGGVFPLAYGIGGSAGFTQPMVFALGWGLLFATLLTLLLIPCTLAIFEDVKLGIESLISRWGFQ